MRSADAVRQIVLDTLRVKFGTQWFDEDRSYLDNKWAWARDFRCSSNAYENFGGMYAN